MTLWFIWEEALCQVGRNSVEFAELNNKSFWNICVHQELSVHLWLVHSCVEFAVSADWEASWSGTPVVGELIENLCYFLVWIKSRNKLK